MILTWKWNNRTLLLIPALLLLHIQATSAAQTIGWVDSAEIYPEKIILSARMDTGAKTSSLRGKSIKRFTRNGEEWLSIEVVNKKHQLHVIERQIIRTAKIKRHSAGPAKRPVIKMGICVADVYKEVEVTITERAGFNYPLLIGRNFLQGSFLIDSASTRTAEPRCHIKP